jgi:hypothetical protein
LSVENNKKINRIVEMMDEIIVKRMEMNEMELISVIRE